jgi:hypothetical protein
MAWFTADATFTGKIAADEQLKTSGRAGDESNLAMET